MVNFFKDWWDKSTGFRHAATTWLAAQITVPLLQVAAWATSCSDHGVCDAKLLPNWHTTFVVIGGGAIAALISGLLKTWQQNRAFPKQ